MKISNFRLKNFLINLLVCFMYPILRYVSNDNSLRAFSDACLIIGLFLALVAVAVFLFMAGDFDITGYIASRAFGKNQEDFDTYKDKQNEKRKDSFNYPLLCAVVLIITSYISSLFC
ncbi:MAG: DUF3899 domain-containing protein [Erysipelotrichaceae bacterium]|nr:DUF3899 domain-containing protein [Erysipelotrichaceae bacterium]